MFSDQSVVRLHETIQIFMIVGYVREMTSKKSLSVVSAFVLLDS